MTVSDRSSCFFPLRLITIWLDARTPCCQPPVVSTCLHVMNYYFHLEFPSTLWCFIVKFQQTCWILGWTWSRNTMILFLFFLLCATTTVPVFFSVSQNETSSSFVPRKLPYRDKTCTNNSKNNAACLNWCTKGLSLSFPVVLGCLSPSEVILSKPPH